MVAETADDLLVMYAGRAVEQGPAREVLARPSHPYTEALLRSIPSPSEEAAQLRPIRGAPPSLLAPPPGCSFHPRCAFSDGMGAVCRTDAPVWRPAPGLVNRHLRCHLADPVTAIEIAAGAR